MHQYTGTGQFYVRIHGLMTLCRLALNSEHTQSLPWHSTVPHAHLCRPVQDDSCQISMRNIREVVTSFSRMVARYKDHDASQSITQYPLVGYAMYSIARGEYSARIPNPMLTSIAIAVHDLRATGWTDREDVFMIGHQVIEGMGTTWRIAERWRTVFTSGFRSTANIERRRPTSRTETDALAVRWPHVHKEGRSPWCSDRHHGRISSNAQTGPVPSDAASINMTWGSGPSSRAGMGNQLGSIRADECSGVQIPLIGGTTRSSKQSRRSLVDDRQSLLKHQKAQVCEGTPPGPRALRLRREVAQGVKNYTPSSCCTCFGLLNVVPIQRFSLT
jgi:hypothetical protein